MKTVTCKIMDAVNEFKGEWNNDAGNYLHLNSIEGRYIFSFKEYLRAFKSPFTLVCSREEFNSRLFGMTANFGESSLKHLRIWQAEIKRQPETDEQHADKLNEMWSKAPEGATHWMPNGYEWSEAFLSISDSGKVKVFRGGTWHEASNQHSVYSLTKLGLKAKPEAQPVFTQSMADNKELPQVGMDCLFKKRGALEAGTVTAITKRFIIFTDSFGDEHVRKLDELTIEPIDTRTNTEKAVDDLKNIEFDKSWHSHCEDVIELIKENKIHGVKWVGE